MKLKEIAQSPRAQEKSSSAFVSTMTCVSLTSVSIREYNRASRRNCAATP